MYNLQNHSTVLFQPLLMRRYVALQVLMLELLVDNLLQTSRKTKTRKKKINQRQNTWTLRLYKLMFSIRGFCFRCPGSGFSIRGFLFFHLSTCCVLMKGAVFFDLSSNFFLIKNFFQRLFPRLPMWYSFEPRFLIPT